MELFWNPMDLRISTISWMLVRLGEAEGFPANQMVFVEYCLRSSTVLFCNCLMPWAILFGECKDFLQYVVTAWLDPTALTCKVWENQPKVKAAIVHDHVGRFHVKCLKCRCQTSFPMMRLTGSFQTHGLGPQVGMSFGQGAYTAQFHKFVEVKCNSTIWWGASCGKCPRDVGSMFWSQLYRIFFKSLEPWS